MALFPGPAGVLVLAGHHPTYLLIDVPAVRSACVNACCAHRVNAKTWIYPQGVPERTYQLDIIRTSLLCNTLVCLPTGLGKTLIAAVVMHNFTRWFPEVRLAWAASWHTVFSKAGLGSSRPAARRTPVSASPRAWAGRSLRPWSCTGPSAGPGGVLACSCQLARFMDQAYLRSQVSVLALEKAQTLLTVLSPALWP